jgi:hypothetical protein
MDDRDLERLVRHFDAILPGLLGGGHEKRWAVFSDDGLLCIESDYGRAYETGRAKFMDRPFIVQQILPRDYVARISPLRMA